jgi:hypothetical protein
MQRPKTFAFFSVLRNEESGQEINDGDAPLLETGKRPCLSGPFLYSRLIARDCLIDDQREILQLPAGIPGAVKGYSRIKSAAICTPEMNLVMGI